jgi:hypothetical protein
MGKTSMTLTFGPDTDDDTRRLVLAGLQGYIVQVTDRDGDQADVLVEGFASLRGAAVIKGSQIIWPSDPDVVGRPWWLLVDDIDQIEVW